MDDLLNLAQWMEEEIAIPDTFETFAQPQLALQRAKDVVAALRKAAAPEPLRVAKTGQDRFHADSLKILAERLDRGEIVGQSLYARECAKSIRSVLALIEPSAGGGEHYWREGAAIIEACLAKAMEAKYLDAPFPLSAPEARIWHQAQAEAYQHALEMMGPPTPDQPKPEEKQGLMADLSQLQPAESGTGPQPHANKDAALPAPPWNLYQHPMTPMPHLYDVVGATRDDDVAENLTLPVARIVAAHPDLLVAASELLRHDEMDAGCIPSEAHLDAQNDLRAAIVKATGR